MNAPLRRLSAGGRIVEVLDVAARVLNSRGVSDEWFSDIASELRISRPALYSHFRDRDDLLFACYSHAIETLEVAFAELQVAVNDEGAALEAFLDVVMGDGFPELAVVAEIDVLPEPRQGMIRGRWIALVAKVADLVRAGTLHGHLKPVDPMVVANSVLGLATWAPLQRRLLPGRPVDAVRSGAKDFFLRGLARERSAGTHRGHVQLPGQPATLDLFDRGSVAKAKREQLLGAASRLFNRRGIGATRVEEIADALGISKRAIFRSFGSKDELVAACFERASEIYQEVARSAAALPGKRIDGLHVGVRGAVLAMGDPIRPSLTSHVGLGRLTPGDQAAMRARFAGLELAYRKMIQEGIDDGSVRRVNVDNVVAALAGNLNWVASADLTGFSLPLETIAVQLADIATTGILV
ncbi:TetR/AcrR family transcriptional regulator [Sphingosinicellaceae bacterium]|nr:TetR/AcrR family transcriptional regulator [Sphingosinicellaceae bacterium]